VLRAFIEGRTGRDIAKEFGLHPAQISRDLARARARLSRELPTNA
jgi:DNA-directed RNA polymerase specialized sigma24 family protein